MFEKWTIFAIAASLLWGSSYAASGPILRSRVTPSAFFFCYSLVGVLVAGLVLFFGNKGTSILSQIRELEPRYAGWFLFSLLTASLGAWMTYQAVGAKNASLAAMIEISYPLFVVIFTWLFFQEIQLNWMTFVGGFLVILGVMIIIKNST
ncbi:MAG: EamA family transporter [Verrucomicrobiae bacterium]|jgi:drug/metabolite transporter (DMT)-like permease|nr:EamA family transporter [Verrucomicrobiae bacterium]